MKSNISIIYKCPELELYSIGRTAWTAYQQHLDAFTSLKPYYTAAFGTAAIAAIDAALALPSMEARNYMPESTRVELEIRANAALFNWQCLKTYIKHNAPKNLAKMKVEAAGGKLYRSAAELDWE